MDFSHIDEYQLSARHSECIEESPKRTLIKGTSKGSFVVPLLRMTF